MFWIFFGDAPSRVRQKQYPKRKFLFLLILGLPSSVWLEMKPEWRFWIFLLIVLIFFLGMLHLGLGRNVTQNEFIFLFFSGLPGPIWLEIKPERRFPFSFLDFFTIFLEWFWECFSPSQAETIPETILFFFFRALFGLKWSQNDFINFFTSCVEFFWECSSPY